MNDFLSLPRAFSIELPQNAGSEMDEDEIMVSESEDSNESWTTEEFSSEFIMRYGSRSSAPNGSNEKPFACPVPGCKKRYKNVNGIKYHSKNGHKKDGKWVKFNHLLSNEIDDQIGANRRRIMTPHIQVRNHGGVCEVVSCYIIDFSRG